MLQTMERPTQVILDSQSIIVGVYTGLVGQNGIIAGPKINPANPVEKTELSRAIGVKPLLRFFSAVRESFPEFVLEIENIVFKGEKVMVKYCIWGLLEGRLLGVTAHGVKMKVSGLDIFRLDDGAVVEYWNAMHQITAVK
jgi:predicted ester cyclase